MPKGRWHSFHLLLSSTYLRPPSSSFAVSPPVLPSILIADLRKPQVSHFAGRVQIAECRVRLKFVQIRWPKRANVSAQIPDLSPFRLPCYVQFFSSHFAKWYSRMKFFILFLMGFSLILSSIL